MFILLSFIRPTIQLKYGYTINFCTLAKREDFIFGINARKYNKNMCLWKIVIKLFAYIRIHLQHIFCKLRKLFSITFWRLIHMLICTMNPISCEIIHVTESAALKFTSHTFLQPIEFQNKAYKSFLFFCGVFKT